MQIPKFEVPEVRHTALTTHEKAHISEIPSDHGSSCREGYFCQDHVSASPTCLNMTLLSVMGSSYSVASQALFKANCSTYKCIFSVTMGGSEFRIILCHHLQLPPPTGCLFQQLLIQPSLCCQTQETMLYSKQRRKGNKHLGGIL